MKAQQSQTFYPDDSYDKIMYFLILERKALFFYVNVIIPSLVIAIVELVTFFLPLTEVVKVHISFTCLLAYSVFQSMVISELPRTSTSVPLLCLYIDLQMSYIGLTLLGEGVVFYFYENSEKAKIVPKNIVKPLVFIGKILLIHDHVPGKRKRLVRPKNMSPNNYFQIVPKSGFMYSTPIVNNDTKRTDRAIETGRRVNSPKERKEFWLFVGEITERINFITYILLISITPAIMFGVMPFQKPDIYEQLKKEFLTK